MEHLLYEKNMTTDQISIQAGSTQHLTKRLNRALIVRGGGQAKRAEVFPGL